MSMKDFDYNVKGSTVTMTVNFEEMAETAVFAEQLSTLIRLAAVGAHEEVQQRAGWFNRTLTPVVTPTLSYNTRGNA